MFRSICGLKASPKGIIITATSQATSDDLIIVLHMCGKNVNLSEAFVETTLHITEQTRRAWARFGKGPYLDGCFNTYSAGAVQKHLKQFGQGDNLPITPIEADNSARYRELNSKEALYYFHWLVLQNKTRIHMVGTIHLFFEKKLKNHPWPHEGSPIFYCIEIEELAKLYKKENN